jgi:piezo-type mechanosensitive ion channel component 1/2
MTYKRMINRYFVAFYKSIISNSEIFCYFWMLFATLTNGGMLYLVYPAMVFGYALLVEERPGKWFWITVLTYTQLLIVANFLLMLNLWQVLYQPD